MVFFIILSLVLVSVVALLVIGKRNYVVVRRFHGADGILEKQELVKFWRIEDALNFIKEYDWYVTDEALNLLNVSRKDGIIKVKGGAFNTQLVYFVTVDGHEGTSFASDLELDAIKSVLGVEFEAAQ